MKCNGKKLALIREGGRYPSQDEARDDHASRTVTETNLQSTSKMLSVLGRDAVTYGLLYNPFAPSSPQTACLHTASYLAGAWFTCHSCHQQNHRLMVLFHRHEP